MAELKSLPRQILKRAGGVDVEPAVQSAKAYEAIGAASSAISKSIGEYVKASNQLEFSTLHSNATTQAERIFNEYKNDPNISIESVDKFNKEYQALVDAHVSNARPGNQQKLSQTLGEEQNKFVTKLLDKANKESYRKAKINTGLALNNYQDKISIAIEDGDFEAADNYYKHAKDLLSSYKKHGATEKEVETAKTNLEAQQTSLIYDKLLKEARDKDQRTQIMDDMLRKLPETDANLQAQNKTWQLFNRLNKLDTEASGIQPIIENSSTGQSYKNYDAPTGKANQVVNLFSQSLANNQELERQVTDAVDLPQISDVIGDFIYIDEDATLVNPDEAIHNGIMRKLAQQTEEKGVKPSLMDIAEATVKVGSKNSTVLKNELDGAFTAGSPEVATAARVAAKYVAEENEAILNLDDKASTIFEYFDNAVGNGEDPKVALDNARNIVNNLSRQNQKINRDAFNSIYSTTGSGRNNLDKAIKSSLNISSENMSNRSVDDFLNMFRDNYVMADGNEITALNKTKRQMAKIHGADRFSYVNQSINDPGIFGSSYSKSKFEYNKNAPTKLMQGQTESQIQNQFLEQIVDATDRNPNIKLMDHYYNIKEANDFDLAEKNLAFPSPRFSTEVGNLDPSIYLTVKQEDGTDVTGRLFTKANSLTEQNQLGLPMWEAWIQDDLGRTFPVKDPGSPLANQNLMLVGRPLNQFAPKYAESVDEQERNRLVDQTLINKGREIAPVLSSSPWRNYLERKEFRESLENIKDAQKRVDKALGRNDE